jgi:hypothetical protein
MEDLFLKCKTVMHGIALSTKTTFPPFFVTIRIVIDSKNDVSAVYTVDSQIDGTPCLMGSVTESTV